MTFQKILVPTDFSPQSENATCLAADIARRYSAELTLLHVHEPVPYELPAGQVANMPSHLDRVFAGLNERLAEECALARAAGASSVEARLLQGPVTREILEHAKSFDLLVIGTRGKHGLEHWVSGSISERLVQTAPCSVMVVRLQKA